ncbi:MAG TPA: M28 family peptidase, partial [Phycisphaerales bacterium]|nr:M28 family peptidase [Phycisphaerales bacterium]
APVAVTAPAPAGMTQPTTDGKKIAALTTLYRQHLYTLTTPWMEGRAPGTDGNRRAADYLEFNYKQLGFKPAFPGTAEANKDVPFASYRQEFIAPPSLRPGDSVAVVTQTLSYSTKSGASVGLVAGKDFNALGYSADGNVKGDVVFLGYGIDEGDAGYTSLPFGADGKRADLTGKIVMVLRFEPMDESGKSRWSSSRWSAAADLRAKFDFAIDKGAAAVILVNPPGADDPRATQLGDVSMGFSARSLKVPVLMMSTDAADAFVRAGDAQGRSLLDLRKVVDEKGEVITLSNATLDAAVDLERKPLYTDNVGAVLPGVGDLAQQYIVIGSHYDHLGYGYFGSRDGEEGRGKLHPGADDNASGTSGNLLVAKRLADAYAALPKDQPRRSVLFLQFCAEESGLNGSKHYVSNPIAPVEQHALMINMDMIGRLREGKLELGGTGTGEGLADFLQPYVDSSGMAIAMKKSGLGPSDHASFANAGIPALFAFTGLHEEYHRSNDFVETINVDGAIQVTDFVYRIAIDAALRPQPFKFTTPTGVAPGSTEAPEPGVAQTSSMSGVRVRFGIAPGDYSGEVKGILIDSVTDGLPAAKAGLKKGDIMTKWNEHDLVDVEQWMTHLAKAKPGDKVSITYVREGKTETTEATLVERRRNTQ